MPHYHLQDLENSWSLIRETPSSQRFLITTQDGLRLAVDVHYTPSKILTASITCIGPEEKFSKPVLTPVLDDLSKIALRRTDYAIVDYSLCFTEHISDGNFTIDKETRIIYNDTL